MIVSVRPRIRSISHPAALGLALALSACASLAPVSVPEPPSPVAASVQALRYTVVVAAVDADTDLGDIKAMVTQALIEGGYTVANNESEADVVLAASLVATRVAAAMTVVVNGQERVERDIKLTLRAQSPGDDQLVDQTTREFSTKEPHIPAIEVAAAVNKLGAGGRLDQYAHDLVVKSKADAEAKAQAEASAEAEAAAADALAAKTRGCSQLSDGRTEDYLKGFRLDEPVDFNEASRIFGASHKWCDVEETTRNRDRILQAVKNAPPFKGGESSATLTPLAKKSLLGFDMADVDFVKAVATAKKKNFVNQYGASMGTIRRVAVVASVGDGAACFMVRGNWRVSNLIDDQDDPEFVELDADGGQMWGLLVECPR